MRTEKGHTWPTGTWGSEIRKSGLCCGLRQQVLITRRHRKKASRGCRVADNGDAAGIDDLKEASRGFPHTGYASCQKRLPMAAIATRNSSKIPLGQQTRLLWPVER
ncbi:hypothetical protein ACLOJK_038668 [Asimina triloba]